ELLVAAALEIYERDEAAPCEPPYRRPFRIGTAGHNDHTTCHRPRREGDHDYECARKPSYAGLFGNAAGGHLAEEHRQVSPEKGQPSPRAVEEEICNANWLRLPPVSNAHQTSKRRP